MIWLFLFGSVFGTLTTGAALGAVLGLTGLIILEFMAGGSTYLAAQAVVNAMNSFTLSAVFMFILMGEVLVVSGLSSRIYGAVVPFFARVPGKLLHTNIVVCTLFAAVSGSSAATAAAVGSAAYPELKKRGYHRPAVLGSLAGGGTLGLLIPPSLSMILYGAWQEVSIGKLFLAGIVPGLMISGLFILFILGYGWLRPQIVPAETERYGFKEIVSRVLGIWPLIVLVVAVLGTIYMGLATPTEAAGLGAVAAIALGWLFGDLRFNSFRSACMRTVTSFGALFFVLVGAVVLGQAISILGLPRELIQGLKAMELTKYEALLLVAILYVLMGCLFDGISMMLMTLPFVFPMLTSYGFDPVWLGVFITIMVEIGMITPPVGMNIFVLAAITHNDVAAADIAKAAIPYWLLLLVGTALLTAFPSIALFLPQLMM